jgi:hypothetical protein
MCVRQISDRLMRDECRFAWRYCRQAVVHHWNVNALQISKVAGNVEGLNLTVPVRQHLVAAKETFNEQAALPGSITLANDVLERLAKQR